MEKKSTGECYVTCTHDLLGDGFYVKLSHDDHCIFVSNPELATRFPSVYAAKNWIEKAYRQGTGFVGGYICYYDFEVI